MRAKLGLGEELVLAAVLGVAVTGVKLCIGVQRLGKGQGQGGVMLVMEGLDEKTWSAQCGSLKGGLLGMRLNQE